jgi:hypothetical protein
VFQDQVVSARYTTPDHTELVYASTVNGEQKITRDSNPHVWLHVHQRVLIVSHDEAGQSAIARPAMKTISQVPVRPVVDLPLPVQQPLIASPARSEIARIAELEAELSQLRSTPIYDPSMGAHPLGLSYEEIEIATEMAVLVMAPEGAVDAGRKAAATDLLSQEAGIRGVAVEDLCRALASARDKRNQSVMAQRLDRLRGAA